jgi:hypothetical protein
MNQTGNPITVLWASLVFQVPHFIFHAANTEPLSTGGNVANLGLLAAGLALTGLLLGRVAKSGSATAREPTAIEGGIGYGAR